MENKVLLYDSNDVKIGETFIRRARQLVKQQRGEWSDESQTAVKFFSDKVEGWETTEFEDDSLIALAEKRIKDRTRIIIHSIVFLPVWLLLYVFIDWFFSGNRHGAIGFISGVWITAFAIHLWQFIANNKRRLFGSGERRAARLAAEIAILKNEL